MNTFEGNYKSLRSGVHPSECVPHLFLTAAEIQEHFFSNTTREREVGSSAQKTAEGTCNVGSHFDTQRKLTMEVDYFEYEDYTPDNETENSTNTLEQLHFYSSQSSLPLVLGVVNIFISVLGLGGNSVVIWICGCKMKRTVLTTWYTSLAISDLLFCGFLPFEVFYVLTSRWPFGHMLCKLTSSALFLNMYSSVFLLVLISADRCVLILFPVWANNHRTVRKACGAVALMWLLSGLLTLPSVIFRTTTTQGSVTKCRTDYGPNSRHAAVALGRFICGFLVPFLIIVSSCVVLGVKLRGSTIRSKRPYKIMVALILSFFFCWVPYHTFVLMELDLERRKLEVLDTGLRVGATLAAANSVISPILYVFIGNDFKQTLKRSLVSRCEEAMAEDVRTGGLNHSRSKSMEIVTNSNCNLQRNISRWK